jgi:site-specific recombinase XerD
MAPGPEGTGKEFCFITCRWLRFAGRLQEPARPPTPHQAELGAYCRYMTEERGLAQATVTTAQSQLPKFLKYTVGKTLKQMRLADVEIYLAHLGKNCSASAVHPRRSVCVVGDRMKRLKIESPRTGPHCLRHACATHLLAQGLTLTEVGGHLGYSSADSTRVYAKVDMPRLREVAELDLGGLL